LLEKLQEVVAKDLPADEMLIDYIFTRQYAIKEAVYRNGSLRADFFRDIYEVEHARRRVDLMEVKMLQEILARGVANNLFDCSDSELGALMILHALKGLETPFMRERVSKRIDLHKEDMIRFIFEGLKKKN
jgi:hypothetical protein